MLNLQIKIFGLLAGIFLILGIIGAHAQTTLSDITFPIQELQGCASLDACRVFCDDFKNASACFSFAEKRGIIKKAEAQKALKFIQLVITGDTPVSGCSDQYECANQCSLPENQSQCLSWAKNNGFITNIPKRAEPSSPPVNNNDQIETPSTENTDQIISPEESNTPEPEVSVTASPKTTTAPKKNLLPTETPQPQPSDTEDQTQDQNLPDSTNSQDTTSDQIPSPAGQGNDHYKQRVERILARENGPGGCTTFDECAEFCSQSQNNTVCLDFARKYGLMSDQDIQKAEQLISRPGPGGCGGQQCQDYCNNINHQEECLKFALDNHFISPTEADKIRNSKKLQRGLQTFGGPGGCTTEEQCRLYCSQASHVEECLSFGQRTGVFNQQEVQQRKQEFQNQLEQPQSPQNQPNSDTQPTPNQNNQEESTETPTATETPTEENSSLPQVSLSPSSSPYPSPSYTPYPSSTPYPTSTDNPATACSRYGGTWNGTTCVMPSQTPNQTTPSPSTSVASTPPSCPSGQYYDSSRQTCGTPADNCTAHGGTWNGTACVMPSPTPYQTTSPSPSSSPYPSPSYTPYPSSTPYPTSTDNPATACSRYGGTWNGTTCVMPNQSPMPPAKTSSIIPGNSLFSSVLRFFGDILLKF